MVSERTIFVVGRPVCLSEASRSAFIGVYEFDSRTLSRGTDFRAVT